MYSLSFLFSNLHMKAVKMWSVMLMGLGLGNLLSQYFFYKHVVFIVVCVVVAVSYRACFLYCLLLVKRGEGDPVELRTFSTLLLKYPKPVCVACYLTLSMTRIPTTTPKVRAGWLDKTCLALPRQYLSLRDEQKDE